ncbi:HbrB-like-domain-containing protein [Leucosporidium creatinivorum]|uniref:HbrB-like-domain-containing protein n=1 Tax=Leucosporidium creatinivorum TaxID=106004 RepID=A0A1Y2EXL1_9BASI|nr:HbrB-like-domain-containing protein [Leucosporidium creatinivorum]
MTSFPRADERQRSSSLSEATPRATTRPFPFTEARVGSSSNVSTAGGAAAASGAGSAGAAGAAAGYPPPLPRHNSGPSTRDAGSQPTSGRASPALSLSSRSLRTLPPSQRNTSFRSPTIPSTGSSLTNPPSLFKSLDSYSSRNVSAALEPGPSEVRQIDDVWQAVCVRVLPLYNGEGVRGYVEELCELVITHVQRTFTRCQSSASRNAQNPSADLSSLVTGLLIADLSELLRMGTTTLSGKLSPLAPAQPLSDEKFLLRLNETWLFFWGSVLPHLEAIFWVLRCDPRLKAAVGGGAREREREGRTEFADGRIDVRKLALIEFRDFLIHPELDRLNHLFNSMYSRPPSSRANDDSGVDTPPQQQGPASSHRPIPSFSSAATLMASGSSTPAPSAPPSRAASVPPLQTSASIQAAGRRRQMVAVLASVLTNDERQSEMDILLRTMRNSPMTSPSSPVTDRRQHRPPLLNVTSSSTWGAGRLAGDRRGFLGERGTTTGQETPLSDAPSEWSEGAESGIAMRRNGSGRAKRRSTAGTMDSLDEDEPSGFSFGDGSRPAALSLTTVTDGGGGEVVGSSTPVGRRNSVRRFLPLLGRSNSGNESIVTASSARTALAGSQVEGGATKLRRHSSQRGPGEESESASQSEREPGL